jgi:hypothetical protein
MGFNLVLLFGLKFFVEHNVTWLCFADESNVQTGKALPVISQLFKDWISTATEA